MKASYCLRIHKCKIRLQPVSFKKIVIEFQKPIGIQNFSCRFSKF
ncbi:hypothetical protein EVA_13172 [gut metagenome]|uniref:Uncharacterized protein n=1 Tax=gut metagenome TaxID=749906 RepID=J9GAD9_9ZZZZ